MMEIDARGLACPTPVVLTKRAIDAGEGDILTTVDNTAATENLKRLGESQGYSVSVTGEGALFRVRLTQSGAARAQEKAPEAGPPAHGAGDWLLLVESALLGSGDAALGETLMTMFFYTLAQANDPPACIFFLNDGVRLPTSDGDVAEHLKTLAQRGCTILSCGTCLNFYGLKDQLKVGAVGSMYDVVDWMQRATKVVRP